MAHIFCLMGKSSTGKDTIYKELLKDELLKLNHLVLYTTRPIREGEDDGVEYHFTKEETYQEMKAQGRIIEERAYDTCFGLWRYFTVDDGSLKPQEKDYLVIGTLEAYHSMRSYFGEERLVPLLIELDDGVRLQRAMDREKQQAIPKYEEMCRRFLADQADFSEENIAAEGITRRFVNEDLANCLQEIKEYIRSSK